jgi:hypothetical protein
MRKQSDHLEPSSAVRAPLGCASCASANNSSGTSEAVEYRCRSAVRSMSFHLSRRRSLARALRSALTRAARGLCGMVWYGMIHTLLPISAGGGCRLRPWSGGARARPCSGLRAQHQPAPSQADAHQCPRPCPPLTPATPARSPRRVQAPGMVPCQPPVGVFRSLRVVASFSTCLTREASGRCTVHQTAAAPSPESRTRRPALARGRVPGHGPDGKPTYCELMLAVQPGARVASVLQVRRISRPMTLAMCARNN